MLPVLPNTPSFPPRPVLVTGAASAIGRAIVARLSLRDIPVLAGVRGRSGQALEPELSAPGVEVLPLDVTRTDDLGRLAARLDPGACPSGLAGVVHCAGLAWAGPLECQTPESLRNLWEVNVLGWVEVTRLALPALRLGRGRVVTVGSVSARVSRPFLAGYGASRLAVEALGHAWELELAPWQIPFITVAAGRVKTELWSRAATQARALAAESPGTDPVADRAASGPTKRAAVAPYRPVLAALENWLAGSSGMAPEQVAAVVDRAITAPRPRRRYRVGSGSWAEVVLPWLPAGVRARWLLRRIPPYGP